MRPLPLSKLSTSLVMLLLMATGAKSLAQNPSHDYAVTPKDLDAINYALCVIPMGRTIDAKALPKSVVNTDWLGKVSSNLPISLVSIPATHDAGTALGRTGATRCQVFTIPAQLQLGIRGYDIRLRLVGKELAIYHGEESQHLKFKEVMDAFHTFLKQHPQEFLVMRVREEANAIDPVGTFVEAFAGFANDPQYKDLFFKATSRTQIPTVGQVRGKIVLLDNYGSLPDAIAYPNLTMSVQDDYDNSDMQKKYDEIIAKFKDAQAEKSGDVWNVNYTSSYTESVDQLANALAINQRIDAYLFNIKGNLGLVFLNFPGHPLISKIINSNF